MKSTKAIYIVNSVMEHNLKIKATKECKINRNTGKILY